MKDLRKQFNRFCLRNRDKGIPNLMLYLCIGTAVVYLMSALAGNYVLYNWLCFDRSLILKGQVWRLFTYPITTYRDNILLQLLYLVCYYSLGRAMENVWGTLKFNLFYLTGVVMMDIYCMIFGGTADVYYLNMSLFLSYATMFPDSQFLLFFIIPVKAWIFALIDLIIVLLGLISYRFPYNLFSVISLANYFLFFGKDVLNIIPMSWRANARRLFNKVSHPKKKQGAKTIPFPNAGSYEASTAKPTENYTHRCTVCGRTDVSNPELEFRYCSRCKGYYCYCSDHINNHAHIE
ncbi:MAG: rhomboid family intramembrane serine protease [Faecousia sp.]